MTSEHAVQLLRAIRDHAGLDLATIRDAAERGAAGGFGGFTYYNDTCAFYQANHELIWDILSDEADDQGYESVPAMIAEFTGAYMADDYTGFQNLLAWDALEKCGRWLEDRRYERTGGRS